jgi:ABC-type lipoprotein export system ATPase subunit
MSDEQPILSFRNASFEEGPGREGAGLESPLRGVHLDLAPGDLVLVVLEEGGPGAPLADAASGLLAPGTGTVAFRGEDWARMHPDRAAACRARIGRVFGEREWISNLDIDENVTLARRFHSRRPEEEVAAEAEALARTFGLDALPRARRPFVKADALRRAAWTRAFLGEPLLLVLERPERDVPADALALLFGAARAALERGAAALVLTDRAALWRGSGLEPAMRLALRGHELIEKSEAVS